MTDLEADIVHFETKLELAHFSLSNCRNPEHRVRLEKTIETTSRQLDMLNAQKEAISHG